MFKNKSQIGKENILNEWINEKSKHSLSPLKPQQTHYFQPSFTKVRKVSNFPKPERR